MKAARNGFLISANFLDRKVDVQLEVEFHVDLAVHFMRNQIKVLPNLDSETFIA